MLSMCSMRGGFIFHNQGPLLKVHHCQHLTSVTKHDTGGSPPGAACNSTKQPHGKIAMRRISQKPSKLGKLQARAVHSSAPASPMASLKTERRQLTVMWQRNRRTWSGVWPHSRAWGCHVWPQEWNDGDGYETLTYTQNCRRHTKAYGVYSKTAHNAIFDLM